MRRTTLSWFSQPVYLDAPIAPLVGEAGFLEALRLSMALDGMVYVDSREDRCERFIMRKVPALVGMAWQVWGADGTYAMGHTFLPRIRNTISLPCLESIP